MRKIDPFYYNRTFTMILCLCLKFEFTINLKNNYNLSIIYINMKTYRTIFHIILPIYILIKFYFRFKFSSKILVHHIFFK